MPNAWIEKLKRFNADGDVWAIPKKNTPERKMLDRGQPFKYTLLKERFPNLSKELEQDALERRTGARDLDTRVFRETRGQREDRAAREKARDTAIDNAVQNALANPKKRKIKK